MISSQAFSIHNFRGTFVQALVRRGIRVHALAPDYDDEILNAALVTRDGAVVHPALKPK